MISAVFSSDSSLSLVWRELGFTFLALIGGVLVLAGLWKEHKSEKPWYSNLSDLRARKLRAECGWKMVMWGIFIETVIGAAFVANDVWDIWHINNKAASADTRNLPIKFISGYARIEVQPHGEREIQFVKNLHQTLPNDEPVFSNEEMNKSEGALLIFDTLPNNDPETGIAEMGIEAQVVFLGTVVSNNLPYVPNICFDLTFDSRAGRTGDVGLWNPNAVTFNELKFVQIEGLGNNEVQPPLEVIGGEIVVCVNGSWQKTFLIPPQTNQFWRVSSFETNNAFVPAGYGLVTNFIKIPQQ